MYAHTYMEKETFQD